MPYFFGGPQKGNPNLENYAIPGAQFGASGLRGRRLGLNRAWVVGFRVLGLKDVELRALGV